MLYMILSTENAAITISACLLSLGGGGGGLFVLLEPIKQHIFNIILVLGLSDLYC